MRVNVPGFDRPIFQPGEAVKDGPSLRAARSFAGLFGKIVARELLKGASDEKDGLMGMGSGPAAEIYGTFLENSLGKVLAESPAMKPLVNQIWRELQKHGGNDSDARLNADQRRTLTAALDGFGTGLSSVLPPLSLPHDGRGPLLLPPPAGVYERSAPLPPPPDK
jgi:hypothetical protein